MENLPKIASDGRTRFLSPLYSGDEPFMLAKNLDGVAVLVDKNRIKSGIFAIEHLGCDTLLLDDGMQYLKLAHELDIVLVDCGAPFGTGAMLPRGTMREPKSSLARASYIVRTKCGGKPQDELIAKIRRYNPVAEIIVSDHGPKYLENVFTGERLPLEVLKGKWVACLSGIARPESFEDSLRSLGANVEICRRFPDHHWFEQSELEEFYDRCADRAMDMIVTTEKDAVRLEKPEGIDLAQAARYFGARGGADAATQALLEKCAVPLLAAATPRAVWLEADPDSLTAAGILAGEDVAKHLEGCTAALLLAVTLGPGVDAQIRRAGVGDIAAGVASDALGSALAEQAAEAAEAELRQWAARQGKYLTGRYSPGYGDWPLAVQPLLAAALDTARRAGLCVTENNLMTPRKSITAILGVSGHPVKGKLAGCGHCVLRPRCEYRKRGKTCASE